MLPFIYKLEWASDNLSEAWGKKTVHICRPLRDSTAGGQGTSPVGRLPRFLQFELTPPFKTLARLPQTIVHVVHARCFGDLA